METIRMDLKRAILGNRIIKINALAALLLLSSGVDAAEIRGRIWSGNNVNAAPPGAVLTIDCPGNRQNIQLGGDGAYSARSLPANKSCSVSIRVNVAGKKISSDSLPVRTNSTVVNFNAQVIIANNNVVVLLPR